MFSGSLGGATNSTNPTATTGLTSEQLEKKIASAFERESEKGQRKGNPIKEFTQEWVNRYLTGESRTERTNWLSDDEGNELAPVASNRNRLSGGTEGWLGLDDVPALAGPQEIPSVSMFSNYNRGSRDFGKKKKIDQPRRQSQNSETLKQSDFWDFGYDPDAVPAKMTDVRPTPLAPSAAAKSTSPISPIEAKMPGRVR
jgi:hypothetical protein